jgi:predicted AAA+ superfamily ATPase
VPDIAALLKLDALAKEEGKKYPRKRELYAKLESDTGKHFVGIVGPRGTGKTILFKQLAGATPDALYISLDTLEEDIDLFELARVLFERYTIKTLFLDEVHYCREYEQKLKRIFDFLGIRLFFTSSVALSMYESAYDLSRRIKLVHCHPFSFREYVYFRTGVFHVPLTITDVREKRWEDGHIRQEHLFEDYMRGGLMPFALEEPDVLALLRNVMYKIVRKDIPSCSSLRSDEVAIIEKVLRFIGSSPVEGINFSSIAKNLSITKYKAEEYLRLLEKAFLAVIVMPAGTNVLKEPKILLCPPYRLLFREYELAAGSLKEDVFAYWMRMAERKFYYLKSSRGAKTPDFLVKDSDKDIIVEIGGRKKGHQQFKGIKSTTSLILTWPADVSGIRRPLFMAGYF